MLATGIATIDLDPGETVDCTYTNTKRGTINIVKDAAPDDVADFGFTETITPITGGSFTLDDDGFSESTGWIHVGTDIDGEAAGDQSGYSVAISADGTTAIIGAALNDGNGSDSGHVRGLLSSMAPTGLRSEPTSTAKPPAISPGYSVAISADGNTVIIGAHLNDGNGSDSGHVRIYRFDGTNWVQVGADIDGEAAGDRSGLSVAINADGTTVIIGAHLNDDSGSSSGHVRIYQLDGTNWVQVGADIDGEAANDQSGHSVAINADGNDRRHRRLLQRRQRQLFGPCPDLSVRWHQLGPGRSRHRRRSRRRSVGPFGGDQR